MSRSVPKMAATKKRGLATKGNSGMTKSLDVSGTEPSESSVDHTSALPTRSTRASTRAKPPATTLPALAKDEGATTHDTRRSTKVSKKSNRSKAPKLPFDVNALPHGLDRKATKSEGSGIETNGISSSVEEPGKTAENINGQYEGIEVAEVGNETADKLTATQTSSKAVQALEAKQSQKIEAAQALENIEHTSDSPKKARKAKRPNQYGVTIGETPYPDHAAPTKEQCQEVRDLLTAAHGKVKAPKEIPVPSRSIAGCGEVPTVLEALLRTHISAHTHKINANRSISNIIKPIEDGPAMGSVRWNDVRLASQEELKAAIREGGRAPTKSKQIKEILDEVYKENNKMRVKIGEDMSKESKVAPLKTDDETVIAGGDSTLASNGFDPTAKDAVKVEDGEDTDARNEISKVTAATTAENEVTTTEPLLTADKRAEMMRLESQKNLLAYPDLLTLDHLHALPASEVFDKLLLYSGVGVKTAACTLLFCMQRPCFAVDTHVWRLCRYLKWVPEAATRDTTFGHCDVRVPDGLKYELHQLLIAHGKDCKRCQAVTGEKSKGWEDAVCCLEHLVTRMGAKKGGTDPVPKRKRKMKTEDGEEQPEDETVETSKSPKAGKAGKRAKGGNVPIKKETVDEKPVSEENGEASPSKKRKAKGGKAPFKNEAVLEEVVSEEDGEASPSKKQKVSKNGKRKDDDDGEYKPGATWAGKKAKR